MAEGYGTRTEYELHRAAFHGDVNRVKEVLEAAKSSQPGEEEKAVNVTDEHGELCCQRDGRGTTCKMGTGDVVATIGLVKRLVIVQSQWST